MKFLHPFHQPSKFALMIRFDAISFNMQLFCRHLSWKLLHFCEVILPLRFSKNICVAYEHYILVLLHPH